MQVVVINQNQADSLSEMSQAIKDYKHIFVLDRCLDNSEQLLKDLHEHYIANEQGTGFLAGRMRNLGLDSLGLDDTLFLDGDRIPVSFSDDLYKKALSMYDFILAKIEHDPRAFSDKFSDNAMWGQISNNCYSCGLLIRKKAIEFIKKFQNGPLFSDLFDGIPAGEDSYLGAVAYHLGFTCGKFPSKVCLKGGPFKSITDDTYLRLRSLLLTN